MSIDQAIADMSAAISALHLGRSVTIDGVAVQAVRRNLTAEELAAMFAGYGQDGLHMIGQRLTVIADELAAAPVVGGGINIDGIDWTVNRLHTIGDNLRITVTRYAA